MRDFIMGPVRHNFIRFINLKHLPTVLVVLMLITGISLLIYPDVAQWWNGRSQRAMVVLYDAEVARLREEQIEQHFRRAGEVNASLMELPTGAPLLVAHLAPVPEDYGRILYVGGFMGRIRIPVIGVDLPILHGTQEALDRGVGHLEGTSFPIGGYGTHSVLTAHTGLPNARMFSDMEGNVNIGDLFFIDVLGRRLAYEVDYVQIIEPHMVESMRIIPGMDLVTLMTCTPYAINSHRLLVRGRRIEYIVDMAEEIELAIVETRTDVRIFVFVAFFLLFMLGFAVYNALQSRRRAHGPSRPLRPGWPVIPKPQPAYEPVYEAAYDSRAYAPPVYEQAYEPAYEQPVYEQPPVYEKPAPAIKRPAYAARKTPKRRSTALPNMTRYIYACLIAILVIAGAGIAAAQVVNNGNGRVSYSAIEDFVARIDAYNAYYRDRWVAEQVSRWLEGGEMDIQEESPLHWLRERIVEHNHNLYLQGSAPPDPFIETQDSFNLSYFGFNDEEMIGFMTLPGHEGIELPIFMGASRDNLRRGAAHITGSSLPIGGPSTNAVIGIHLGNTNLESRIEEITTGQEIQITNFYETITYTITHIFPSGTMTPETTSIQSDRDTVTILGYRPGSQNRYAIIATRAGSCSVYN